MIGWLYRVNTANVEKNRTPDRCKKEKGGEQERPTTSRNIEKSKNNKARSQKVPGPHHLKKKNESCREEPKKSSVKTIFSNQTRRNGGQVKKTRGMREKKPNVAVVQTKKTLGKSALGNLSRKKDQTNGGKKERGPKQTKETALHHSKGRKKH